MESALLKKLFYKGGTARMVNAPEGYHLGVESSDGTNTSYDFIQLFVKTADEARAMTPTWLESIHADGVFWITYPKQSSGIKTDINRDILATMIQNETEYRVVSNVSIDDTWSALRLRHKDKVKSKA